MGEHVSGRSMPLWRSSLFYSIVNKKSTACIDLLLLAPLPQSRQRSIKRKLLFLLALKLSQAFCLEIINSLCKHVPILVQQIVDVGELQ